MKPSFFRETKTAVHSQQALLAQRSQAYALEQYVLAGLCVYSQIVIGAALYLYDHVSTPGYLSVLLTAPFLLLLYGGMLFLARRVRPEQGLLLSAVGSAAAAPICLLLCLGALLDALAAGVMLCAMIGDVLPQMNVLRLALAAAAVIALAIGGEDEYDLPRRSRFLRWGLALVLIFCACTALPYGNPGHLFPLLSKGPGSVFEGALWMCGCAAGACCPLALPQKAESLRALTAHPQRGLRELLTALLFGALTVFFAAYLLPFYALARPETLGWRALLYAEISSSLTGWSLLLCAQMFLMLFSLATGVTRAAALLSRAAGKKKSPPWLLAALLLLLMGAAGLNPPGFSAFLLAALPWRAVLALLALAAMVIGSLLRGKPGKEQP